MKKIQLLLLMLSLPFLTTACQPALKEFQPEADSLFKITFSYPASWDWEEDIPFDELMPGEEPSPSERIVFTNAPLSIQVYKPSDPQAQMQEWMDGYLGAVTSMLSADTTIQIDGYNARWLTVLYPPQGTGETHIQEVLYLLTEDRFYTIDSSISESKIDGQVHKEFQELIKTIKVWP
jgi:hypothetical protein